MSRIVGAAGSAVFVCLLAAQAQASDWVVTVGARAQALVPYEGADHDVFLPVPALHVRRAGEASHPVLSDDGVGIGLIHIGPVAIGPTVRLRGKRDSDGAYAGLRQVPLAIEPGLYVTAWPTSWLRLHGEARRGVRGHEGWIGDASLDLVASRGAWTGTIGPRAGWGDHRYMDAYFGVTPAEAAASPIVHAAYQPGGGMRYAGVHATLVRRLGGGWETTGNVGYHRLAAIPAGSQIIQRIGNRDEISGGVGLRYSFNWTH